MLVAAFLKVLASLSHILLTEDSQYASTHRHSCAYMHIQKHAHSIRDTCKKKDTRSKDYFKKVIADKTKHCAIIY